MLIAFEYLYFFSREIPKKGVIKNLFFFGGAPRERKMRM